MTADNPKKLTPEEYFTVDLNNSFKCEYIDGIVYEMAEITDHHNRISGNLAVLIHRHLKGTACRVYFAKLKVRIEAGNCFYYPDLFVTCDAKDRNTATCKRFLKLIIEVLSESTEKFDRGDKFSDYQALASLEEYVLLSTQHQRVEIFRREDQS